MSPWVLLRGLTRERRHWGNFPDRLQAALPGARVIALDLPGNGVRNTLPSPLSVAAMVQDLRIQLQRLGIGPPWHLFAMSLGGMVAIDWATRHPGEISGAVLINTSDGRVQPFYRRLKPGAWLQLLRSTLPGLSAAQRERLIAHLTSQRLATADAAPREWVACRESHPVSRVNAWRQWLAALRFDAPLEPPPVPLLLLGSAGDRLVDPRCSRSLAMAWNATHAEHPTAGHDLAFDDPEWLLHTVRDWLAIQVQ
jgi:pimeloyl-ACP methyl ester carboxylesterase